MGTEVIKIRLLGQRMEAACGASSFSLLGVQPCEGSHGSRLGWTGGMGDAGAVGAVVMRTVLCYGDRDPLKAPGSMG